MDPEQIRRLVAYNQYADEKILSAIEGMSPEELEAPRDAYFGTIAANLWHTLNAEQRWRPLEGRGGASARAAHHRAETGLLLERMGRSPGDIDYVLFLAPPISS